MKLALDKALKNYYEIKDQCFPNCPSFVKGFQSTIFLVIFDE